MAQRPTTAQMRFDTLAEINALGTTVRDGQKAYARDTKREYRYTTGIGWEIMPIKSEVDAKVSQTRTVNGKALSSDISLNATDIGLSNVNNTSDLNKPVSTLQQAAIDAAFATVNGKIGMYIGTTFVAGAYPLVQKTTIASGVATFDVSDNGAVFANVYTDYATVDPSSANDSLQHSAPSYNASTKKITSNIKKVAATINVLVITVALSVPANGEAVTLWVPVKK